MVSLPKTTPDPVASSYKATSIGKKILAGCLVSKLLRTSAKHVPRMTDLEHGGNLTRQVFAAKLKALVRGTAEVVGVQ